MANRVAIVTALALLTAFGTPAGAFDIGMMDAANSLPGYVDAANLPPRSEPVVIGSRYAATDAWNVPVAWSGEGRGGPLVRNWARNLPVDTNEWNVPLWFITDPPR